jgi:Rrf2 family nitric oxide-sensitive transcriptional repressor
MQLTRFTDLGLRVLMYLTQHERPDPVTNAEIASQFGAPHNHVIKVVHRLGKLGWVHTQRGRTGGLSLGVSPDALHLGDVLRELETADELVDCAHPPCVLRGHCLLKNALDEGMRAFYETLNRYTLADLAKHRTGKLLVQLQRKYTAANAS